LQFIKDVLDQYIDLIEQHPGGVNKILHIKMAHAPPKKINFNVLKGNKTSRSPHSYMNKKPSDI
jgi:hypothetical protein